mgnify:CR=1 FL=1
MTCRRARAVDLLVPLFLLVTLQACTTAHRAHRPMPQVVSVAEGELESRGGRLRVGRASLERHASFTLGVVEFDDQGYFWDRRQIDALEAEIRREAKVSTGSGALITVFVHGWRHTSEVCDTSLCCFREALRNTAEDQTAALALSGTDAKPARVFGVFVGWRGLSKRVWPLEYLSFFSRKNVAVKVGAGDMTELLTRLDRLRRELNAADLDRSRLVVVGHSLGATVVYSAISGVLKSRLAETRPAFDPQAASVPVVRGFGDLVVLVNPALDAVAFHPLWDMASRFPAFSRNQSPILIVVGSETDSATGSFFPLGQAVATLFEKTRDAEQRRALRTAVGNYEPFVSHRLTAIEPANGTTPEPKVEGCRCHLPHQQITRAEVDDLIRVAQAGERRTDAERGGRTGPSWGQEACEPTQVFGRTLLTCVKPVLRGNPVWVVRAAPEVLHEHGGFYNPLLGDFLRRLILGGEGEPATK